METFIYAIFLITYALIASRRLSLLPIGRPAGALLGAVLMVAFGALSPEESYRAIDHDTILLLFCMMVLTVYLKEAGFFDWISFRIIRSCKTPFSLLCLTAIISGVLSAFLVNDTVCLFMTPMLIATCTRANLPLGPFLIALATSANIGSSATLVGNPQNMIIGSMSNMGFSSFLMMAGPAAGIGLIVNIFLLWFYYGRSMPATLELRREISNPPSNGPNLFLVLFVTGGVTAGFFAGFHMGYTTLAGVMVLVIVNRKDPRDVFSRVDWPLLVFFCCLFIVVAGLASTGLIERAWRQSAPYFHLSESWGLTLFTALLTAGSNLVSNVPMVLLAGPHINELGAGNAGWVLLAFTTTVAGNFTILGSVANIIVAECSRDAYHLGFMEYFRFGMVSTIAVLAIGCTYLWAVI
ncbi:MAG: anion transporter [Desulfobacteraceae bacterium]|jgi:Na+/H+ antiporter NhaD/arsenite permease-like protein|nr:MAG: anion transporter [Desulfobacteraceae bacterium]